MLLFHLFGDVSFKHPLCLRSQIEIAGLYLEHSLRHYWDLWICGDHIICGHF